MIDKQKGILLILMTALISGLSIFINKFSLASIDSSVFTFFKNITVGVLLFSVILFTKEIGKIKKITKSQWINLVLIGLIGGSIPFLLFFKGLSLTSAISGAFIHKTLFIYASLFAFIFLKEKINKKFFFVATLLLTGNFLLLKLTSFSWGLGESLILIAALFWAAENVLSKYVLKDLSGNLVAFGRMFFGSLFILMFLLITNKLPLVGSLNFSGFLWVIVTSVLLFLFVMTYYNGLKHVKVSVATSILLLGSPITSLLSFLFLGGNLVLSQVIGILLVFLGVVVSISFVEMDKINQPSRLHIHNE